MSKTFNTIGLIGKYGDPGAADTIKQIRDHLSWHQLRVLLDEGTARNIPDHAMETADRDRLGAECNLVVVVGGDGTLLSAARSLSNHYVSVVGVNLGRLGFLVDVSPSETTDILDEILAGQYIEEMRLLLHAEIERDGEVIFSSEALNDVVIHKWGVARMLEFETWVNGRFVHTHRSDGLIVSTPTGSTAYALSGGGPILHPLLEAVVLVPICPHTLSNRPIVVEASSEIQVTVSHGGEAAAQLTCDGQIHHRVEVADVVRVRAHPNRLRLLHPASYDYFHILRNKLRWSEHP